MRSVVRLNLQKQDAAAAVIDFRKALLLNPEELPSGRNLLLAYLMQKEFRQAEVTLHEG